MPVDDTRERLARLEGDVAGVRAMRENLRWWGGLGLSALLLFAGWGIQRTFVVSDGLTDVKLAAQDGAIRLEGVQSDLKDLKASQAKVGDVLTDVRLNVERIATAVKVEPFRRDPDKPQP
jgi:hypothetical protein